MLKRINLNLINIIYICFMIVYMAIREILPLNFLISNPLISAAIFAVGAILIVIDLFSSGNCLKGKVQDILILFLFICGITSIINIKYGFVGNAKMIAALLIEYFIFFSFAKCDTKEELTQKLNWIMGTLTIVWSIIVMFSISMYFFNIDIIIIGRGTWGETNQGFSNEYLRLWGILQDPNYAGATSIISLLASVRFFFINKKVGVRILNVLNILLQVMYVLLCGSRASFLLLVLAIVVFAVYKFVFGPQKKTLKGVAKGVLLTTVTSAICIAAIFGTKAGIPYIKAFGFTQNTKITKFVTDSYIKLYDASGYEYELLSPIFNDEEPPVDNDDNPITSEPSDDTSSQTPQTQQTPTKPQVENIDRTDIKDKDVSNGRFKRWIQTLQIFSHSPIFGTSPRNLSAFAKEHNPETIIALYDIAPHNGYLDVLAGTGIVGFIVLALACILVLFTIVKDCLKNGFSVNKAFLLSAIAVLMGIAFFVSDVFMIFSMNSLLFWCIFGIAYNYCKNSDDNGYCYTFYSKTVGKLINKSRA